MSTLIIQIDVPAVGELELTGQGHSPTDAQMAEETAAREQTLEVLRPYLSSLPERPPRRAGNVIRVQLLGGDNWSKLNHYAVLVTVDIGTPPFGEELERILPAGSKVVVSDSFAELDEWPSPEAGAQA